MPSAGSQFLPHVKGKVKNCFSENNILHSTYYIYVEGVGIVQYSTIISYITLHYIIYYINHATSHQYSASCDPQDRVGPKALTSIDIHATSHHYTTKVPLALNTIVSHATSYT